MMVVVTGCAIWCYKGWLFVMQLQPRRRGRLFNSKTRPLKAVLPGISAYMHRFYNSWRNFRGKKTWRIHRVVSTHDTAQQTIVYALRNKLAISVMGQGRICLMALLDMSHIGGQATILHQLNKPGVHQGFTTHLF